MTTFPNVLTHEIAAQTTLDSGTDDTSVAAAFLTDTTKTWTIDQYVGFTILNVTDGSSAVITGNTATTVIGVLAGGIANVWNSGDAYTIVAIGQLTGVAPDGTDSLETIKRGRIRRWSDCTVGGLFPGDNDRGVYLTDVIWSMPAATDPDITVSLVDDDLFEYPLFTQTGASGFYQFTSKGILVPRDWKIKVVSSLVSSSDGRVTIYQKNGMSKFNWSYSPNLGQPKPLPGQV